MSEVQILSPRPILANLGTLQISYRGGSASVSIAVTQSGAKWTLPRAGKVAYKDGAVDESKLGENPSGIKLTY